MSADHGAIDWGARTKVLVFVLALLPAAQLLGLALLDRLGANPAEALIRASGDWTLRFLCIVLAVTPVRIVMSWSGLARLRRMLGLFCFFYAMLHASLYAGLDMGLDWGGIGADIRKRPFILLGFSAWCLLLLLAATSWDGAVRWLGGKRWRQLHRLVFVVVPVVVLHFYWMRQGKHNFTEVWWYASILFLLLAFRLLRWARNRLQVSEARS
ncbi:protein-methionine-sulfoxide reductase heme-binding subunit MsrQ [Curvibacter sp. APW13]|uniref:sulfite oxidase heme-binding subunit YedZ n=1 Tax=Curvibacter sp. APW13 TaxID=3077236 RepID=UPI0028DDE608|nr:protein-methionine-sulfoxide reductase heme-binding subunit MsrQ [Curvibacter sp. APW13]MDT8989594.1 protein-methionine-sulfoxide reductase heme-binding subunit MsrQ [Curvibacter sp. APW13]